MTINTGATFNDGGYVISIKGGVGSGWALTINGTHASTGNGEIMMIGTGNWQNI